ncbi:50S ribosomal protein L10 [Buchnera aphidicola (Kurisakia onigurumii)]|uniref:50S ribosomal protein L10 n=1 Tax=Buchnera aphidicola TaxID=9 RepID=UPI0031B6B504
MILKKQDKEKIISKINLIANSALSLTTVIIKGASVNTINNLRKEARENKVNIHVVRNTLLKRSLSKTSFECIKKKITGPILTAFSLDHPGSAVRILKKFEKNNNGIKINNAVFEGKILSMIEIDNLAVMPTYKEAISRFIFLIQEASIGKLLRVLSLLKNTKKK